MLRFLFALPLVALPLLTAACSTASPSSAAAAALQAGVRDSSADTARFTVEAQVHLPGGDEPIEFTAHGQVDMPADTAEFIHETPEGYPSRTIFADGRIYQTWLDTEYWQSGDAGASSTFSAAPQDTLRILARAEEVIEVGRETLDGFEATHYRATITSEMFESEGNDLYEGVSGTFDVWISEDRILRIISDSEYGDDAFEGLRGQRSTVRIDWSDWGTPVDIRLPDPSLIKSIEELSSMYPMSSQQRFER